MKVIIIKGPATDKRIQDCYDIIAEFLRKEIKDESDVCKGVDR